MSRTTNYLLIDISNSFTKLAFASRTRLGRSTRIETDKLTSAFVRRFLKRCKIDMLVVASVVPPKNREVRKATGRTKVLWLNPRLKLGGGTDYQPSNTIGADRLGNAAAVAALDGCPARVVDLGTVVKYDVV